VSSIAVTAIAGIDLISDYQSEKSKALEQIQLIEEQYIPSITESVWNFDYRYLELQLQSLRNLPHVCVTKLKHADDLFHSNFCPKDSKGSVYRHSYSIIKKKDKIGHLEIGIDLTSLKKSYIEKAIQLFIIKCIELSILCILLINIFNRVVLRYFLSISDYMKTFSIDDDKRLVLNRKSNIDDEITALVRAINTLKTKLSTANMELINFNHQLEDKVHKRTEEVAIQKEKGFAAAKLAALGQMAGGIAHEINNPLCIISMTVTNIRSQIKNDNFDECKLNKSFDKIDMTITRISKIIKGLKTISRDGEKDDFINTDLETILHDVLSVCSSKLKLSDINLIINLNNKILKQDIYANQVQLSQVFINLLNNSYDAIQHLNEKWVRFDFNIINNKIEIKLTDSGKGIPKEIREQIFSPFFTSKPIGEGTGLGLSISKSIIEEHNGIMKIEESSSNTQFIITLPYLKEV
jgi:C4-dicarboxylate-specific signal transduction histidine kinase